MKVDFNNYDFNLWKIKSDSGLEDLPTKILDFDIYGLIDSEDKPLILLSYDFKKLELSDKKRSTLYRFFKNNGFRFGWKNTCNDADKDQKLHIGLQYDLRKDVDLCSAILQTIVFFLEEKIALKNKVPGIPRITLDK